LRSHFVATDVTSARRRRGYPYGVLILPMLTGIVDLDGAKQGQLLFRTDIIAAHLPWYFHLCEQLRDLSLVSCRILST